MKRNEYGLSFQEQLCFYKNVTQESLLQSLPDKEPKKYLYDLIKEYHLRNSKGLRPALCLATTGIFGGDIASAMPTANAIECLHNAFLVHDDIEDQSEQRRGQNTLNAENGAAIAVNVGDAMNVIGLGFLTKNEHLLGKKIAAKIFEEFHCMITETVEGQALELGWIRDNIIDLTEEDYLRMILKKTSWYTTINPIRIGAIIGSKGSADIEQLNNFGFYLGGAFQIQDDILNLVGKEEIYGKEIYGDILEGKRTLMMIRLFAKAALKEKKILVHYLSLKRGERTMPQVRNILELMEKYECISYAKAKARQMSGAALKEFYSCFSHLPSSNEKNFVEEMIFYVIQREQ